MGVGSFLDIYVLNFDVCGQEFQTRQGQEEESETRARERRVCRRVCESKIKFHIYFVYIILKYILRRNTSLLDFKRRF
jgi:hypothetical protein